MSRNKSENLVSPKGVFVYPHLTSPDTEYNANGVYHVKLRLSADDAEAMITMIDKAVLEKVASVEKEKGKKPKLAPKPYTIDEETGDVLFKFSMNASGRDKDSGKEWTRKPGLKGNRKINGKIENLPDDVSIWTGTLGKVSYSMFPYFVAGTGAGVKLRLKAVQVLELVSGSEDYGFDAEEVDEDIDEAQSFAKSSPNSDNDEAADDADF